MLPLFFVHIPKTAGTSFRLGAEACFGANAIAYDYGRESEVTSAVVREHLYGEVEDLWGLKQACAAQKRTMLGGHVKADRFVSLVGVGRTLTFLREPLHRLASEYGHFVRHYEYKGSFRDFYLRPVMHNRQARFLQGVDLEALGFLALTERYADSLKMLNAHFRTEVPLRKENRGKGSADLLHELSTGEREELARLNRRDIALHERAVALFETRLGIFQQGKVWAHARLTEANAQRVAGWAWWADASDAPVEVEIWINDRLAGTSAAVEFRPGLCRLRPPRGGHVGFHLPAKLALGDRVQCRVVATGQWFPAKPRRVRAIENR